MSILIIALIVIAIVIVIIAIAMKSKRKGGELMTQQPASEPQSPPSQPTPDEASLNMNDLDSEPQI